MPSARVKTCALRMLISGRAQGTGNLAEEAGAVPGGDLHAGEPPVRFVMPVQHGVEGLVSCGELVMHEPVRAGHVGHNLLRGVNLKIAGRQIVEVTLDLIAAKRARSQARHFLRQQFALGFPRRG
jgi:hypothetical protein